MEPVLGGLVLLRRATPLKPRLLVYFPSGAHSYNNLLGFPYLNGYSLHTLNWLLLSTGFKVIRSFAASLLTPPYPEMTQQLRREWQQTRAQSEHLGAVKSPWIEVVGQAVAA